MTKEVLEKIVDDLIAKGRVPSDIVNDYYDEFVDMDEFSDTVEYYVDGEGFHEWLTTFDDDAAIWLLDVDEVARRAAMDGELDDLPEIASTEKKKDARYGVFLELKDYMEKNWQAIATKMFYLDDRDARADYVSQILGVA